PASSISKNLFLFIETSSVPNLGTRFQRLIQRIHFAFSSKDDLLKESYDAIFIFKPYDFATAWLWRKWGIQSQVIASLHGMEFFAGDRFFSKAVNAMYSVSEATAEQLSK